MSVTSILNLFLMFSDCYWRDNSFPTVFWFFAALHLLWGCWHASWGLVVPLLCPLFLWLYKQQTSGKLQNMTKMTILDLLFILDICTFPITTTLKIIPSLSVVLSLNFSCTRFWIKYCYLLSTAGLCKLISFSGILQAESGDECYLWKCNTDSRSCR